MDHTLERDAVRRASNRAWHQANGGVPSEGTRRCTRCGADHPLDEFPPQTGKKAGRHSWCRPCLRTYNAEWARKNRAKVVASSIAWKKRNPLAARLTRHPINVEQFWALVESQDGRCGICRKKPDDPVTLHVDHDHQSGKVRGLLCHPCNTGLGKLGDTEEGLQRALDYLRASHKEER